MAEAFNTHRTTKDAMRLAEQWTHDMSQDRPIEQMPLFDALKTLLDHCRQQGKDIEELTNACQVLFRENRRLQDDLRRSSD